MTHRHAEKQGSGFTFADPGTGSSSSNGYGEGDLADLDGLVEDLTRGEDA